LPKKSATLYTGRKAMYAEAAQVLIFKKDRDSGFYSYTDKEDKDEGRQSARFWDELAQKWPQVRFSSFFTADQNA
jgi:hypothetical protein